MNMRLMSLGCTNFKGLKSFSGEFNGENAVIKAANGVGKTSVYDAFLWLLFGKDSTGRKEFELRPLDKDNQPITGLVLSVSADIEIDGTVHTFRKEHREKVVKKQLRGYETLCWINDVPKKAKEYSDFIGNIIPEETFKLLTDLSFFNGKMHWKARRAVLLAIAGEIATPEGFDDLFAVLNSRNVDEYKKVLAEQKKRHEKDRDEIDPRIDEIQRGLGEYSDSADKNLEPIREGFQKEIAELDNQRQELVGAENKRQAAIEAVNKLKANRADREVILKTGTSGDQKYIDEKTEISTKLATCRSRAAEAKSLISIRRTAIDGKESELRGRMIALDAVREEFGKLQTTPTNNTCGLCGQTLPANKISEAESKTEAMMQAVTKKGNAIKNAVLVCKAEIEDLQEKAKELQDDLEKANIQLKEGEEYAGKRVPILDDIISKRPAPDFKQDETWRQFSEVIEAAEKEIGEPVPSQLAEIEAKRQTHADDLADVNSALAKVDRMKQDGIRIKELEAQKKNLAQLLADVDRQLDMIEQFKAAESRLVETAVNGKFKHVEFKLFNELLNGVLEDCCEATFNGIPYSGLSRGEEIFVGIDINNVLSDHHDISAPLFIDQAESMTMPIEATCQVIELYAQKGIETLTIEKKGKL